MKAMAKAQGLWNLWISSDLAANMCDVVDEAREPGLLGAGLSNLVRHLALSKRQALRRLFGVPSFSSCCTTASGLIRDAVNELTMRCFVLDAEGLLLQQTLFAAVTILHATIPAVWLCSSCTPHLPLGQQRQHIRMSSAVWL